LLAPLSHRRYFQRCRHRLAFRRQPLMLSHAITHFHDAAMPMLLILPMRRCWPLISYYCRLRHFHRPRAASRSADLRMAGYFSPLSMPPDIDAID